MIRPCAYGTVEYEVPQWVNGGQCISYNVNCDTTQNIYHRSTLCRGLGTKWCQLEKQHQFSVHMMTKMDSNINPVGKAHG